MLRSTRNGCWKVSEEYCKQVVSAHELGDDRWRDFLFLSLCLVVLAFVVWVIHVAIWGIEVRRVPMMRVAVILGIYMAFMVHARPLPFVLIVAASVAIGELHSRLLLTATTQLESFWPSFALSMALWCATAFAFAAAGSRLTGKHCNRVTTVGNGLCAIPSAGRCILRTARVTVTNDLHTSMNQTSRERSTTCAHRFRRPECHGGHSLLWPVVPRP